MIPGTYLLLVANALFSILALIIGWLIDWQVLLQMLTSSVLSITQVEVCL